MSAAAAEYYSQIAHQFGEDQIPEVLSGNPYLLEDPGRRITAFGGDHAELLGNYETAITVVGGFVVSHAEKPTPAEDAVLFRFHQRYTDDLTRPGRLVPIRIPRTNTKLATGYIRGVQIEAVTPQDLPDGMFERATFRYPEAREHDNNALLVESAELVLGRAVYRVASLTVVANDEKRPYNYRLHAASFGHNEIQKAAALWESGVPAREIGSWGLMCTVELSEE